MRKIKGSDAGQLYAMKVLKKATLKGKDWDSGCSLCFCATLSLTAFVIFLHCRCLMAYKSAQICFCYPPKFFLTIVNVLKKHRQKTLPTYSVGAGKQGFGVF